MFGLAPHTSKTIQRLEQSSYVILTFKYVGGMLLVIDVNKSDAVLLGIIFILLASNAVLSQDVQVLGLVAVLAYVVAGQLLLVTQLPLFKKKFASHLVH